MVPLITVILAAYAALLVLSGIQNNLPVVAGIGVGFAVAAAALYLKRSWSKWLVLAVCLLYVVGGCLSIWVFYENAGRNLESRRVLMVIVPGLLMMLVAAIVPSLAFRALKKEDANNVFNRTR